MRGSVLLAACTLTAILESKYPGSVWVLRGDAYNGLEWLDQSVPKPTSRDISNATADCLTAEAIKEQERIDALSTLRNSSRTEQDRIEALIKVLDLGG